MKILALSGYARSGKDEFADVLVNEYGYTRVAFADKLREVLYGLNPLLDTDINFETISDRAGNFLYETSEEIRIHLQDVIDEYGWGGYKETKYGPEIRRLLQRLGTEAGRQTLWDSIWIDAAFAGLPDDAKVVITDMRFKNEAKAIYDRGGLMVRVHRPGVGPVNNHISETDLDDYPFHYHIENDGTLEEYKQSIRESGIV